MIGVLLILAAGAAFIDAVRRPASQWVEADRNKAFWLTMIVILNVVGVVAYVITVVPRFPRGAGSTDTELLKPPAGIEG
jgi:Phospholipase_D-nuclease N-terminal